MQITQRSGLRLACLMFGTLAALPLTILRAEDAPKPAATPTTLRSREAVMADLSAAGKEVRASFPSISAFSDAKQREAIAPKAIPAIQKYVAAFDELAEQDPLAKAQAVAVHTQFLSMLAALGDNAAEKRLATLAEGESDDAIEGKSSLLMAKWWKSTGDALAQKSLLEEARGLMKAHEKNDTLAITIADMADQGPATAEIKDAARQIIVDHAKGERGEILAKGFESVIKLKKLEGKELVIAGLTNQGNPFTTADWKGKVILVDFWATWCVPCRAALPKVKKAYAEYHAKGLEIVGVSCDREGRKLQAFLSENPDMPWPQLFDDKAPGWHALAAQLGIEMIPTMFLIDKKGILRSVTAGENFEEAIPKMLEEK